MCTSLQAYMLTCLHAYMRTRLHVCAYMYALICLDTTVYQYTYVLTCLQGTPCSPTLTHIDNHLTPCDTYLITISGHTSSTSVRHTFRFLVFAFWYSILPLVFESVFFQICPAFPALSFCNSNCVTSCPNSVTSSHTGVREVGRHGGI